MIYSSDWQRFSSLVLRSSSLLAEYEARGLPNLGVLHLYKEDWKWMGKNYGFKRRPHFYWRPCSFIRKTLVCLDTYTTNESLPLIFQCCLGNFNLYFLFYISLLSLMFYTLILMAKLHKKCFFLVCLFSFKFSNI